MSLRSILLLGICSLAATSGQAADPFPADNDFVRKAERAGNQEIADARAALSMSKNAAVLAVAKRMEDDGSVLNQRLAALAVEKGWPTPALDPPDTMPRYTDSAYETRQIRGQQETIAFYVEEAANGADTKLQEFARATLPTLRQRLESLRLLRTS